MDFNERIKALRTHSFMTQKELGDRVGVSVVTVRCWESGTKSPSMGAIISLAKIFNVTTDYLLGVVSNPRLDFSLLDINEKRLITNYRTLDECGRNVVLAVCKLETDRANKEAASQKVMFHKVERSSKKSERFIPRYSTPSAAGFSAPIDAEDFEMIPISDSVPKNADFAVRIQGDSMNPYIFDGDTVYVQRTSDLKSGDVGIFSVNGAMYCKQYYVDELRNLYLLSANPKYKHTNVYAACDSDAQVKCFGKVLLKNRINLPDYFQNEQ